MKRIAVLLAAVAAAVLMTFVASPAQAEDSCTVQPLVAGECVSQPVADYVLGQQATISDLMADRDAAWAFTQKEQAAHQETRLELASAYAHADDLQTALAKAQARVERQREKIAELRAELNAQ